MASKQEHPTVTRLCQEPARVAPITTCAFSHMVEQLATGSSSALQRWDRRPSDPLKAVAVLLRQSPNRSSDTVSDNCSNVFSSTHSVCAHESKAAGIGSTTNFTNRTQGWRTWFLGETFASILKGTQGRKSENRNSDSIQTFTQLHCPGHPRGVPWRAPSKQ